MTWKFRDTVQADFSGLDSLGERRQKLIEHFRTRTNSERPLCVRSVTVFADLEQLVFEAPGETRTISISIIGYVQTKQSRMFTMTNWIKSANWEPITGGLFSNCEFLNYLDYADSPSKTWYKMPIFGEVGLNNQGRIAEKSDRTCEDLRSQQKVICLFILYCFGASLKFFWFAMSSTAPSLVSSAPRSVVPIRCRSTTSYNTWPCQGLLVKSPTRYEAGLGHGAPVS